MDAELLTAAPTIRILIVDDHPAVRQGLALLLAPDGIDVCAEAGGRIDALACLETSSPDLAIVDLSLDGEDGLGLVAELQQRAVRVLVYSMHNDARRVGGAFAAGALGYVTKRELHGVLVQAIREVAAGRRFVSPNAAVALADRVADLSFDEAVRRLSAQEREVYQCLGRGDGTPEIARAMQISTHTVESYYARILVKLGLNGMHELRHHAIEHVRNETA